MNVPLYNAQLPLSLLPEIETVIASGQIAHGKYVGEFEVAFGTYLRNSNVAAVGEISTAISICLACAGLVPGDEVVMSPLVCLSSSCPVKNFGAKIRWCDVDPHSGNIDPLSFEQAIGPRTKAVLVYHWAGYPAEIEQISQIARDRGIAVIEDAGEALGASYAGCKIGSGGTADFPVFSFYPNRHLSTIEGGMIACKHEEALLDIRRLRRYGIDASTFRTPDGEINPASDVERAGWNSYLNNISAVIGLSQMPLLERRLESWGDNGRYYDRAFAEEPGIEILKRPGKGSPAYWVYTLLSDRAGEVMRKLRAAGVQSSKIHLRNDHYSAFGGGLCALSGVEEFSRRSFSIPCGPWVSPEAREFIVQYIMRVLKDA